MEASDKMQDEVSWLSVICGICGILLLAVYILLSSGNQDPPSAAQPEKAAEQKKAVTVD